MCMCGQMDGAEGLHQTHRANSSPMALGTGLSIHGGSTLGRPEQILQEAPQISIYSSFQVNLLVPCLLAFLHGGGWQGNVLHLISLPLDSKYSVISWARITPPLFIWVWFSMSLAKLVTTHCLPWSTASTPCCDLAFPRPGDFTVETLHRSPDSCQLTGKEKPQSGFRSGLSLSGELHSPAAHSDNSLKHLANGTQ